MNKKGETGEQISVFMFLFLLLIIGVGIVAGVFIFFGKGYDYRESEAGLLNYKIEECLMENELTTDFFKAENFFEKCKLNKGIIEENSIIRICSGVENCANVDKGLLDIGSNFQSCGFEGVKKNRAYPLCVTGELNKGEKKFTIITGSKQASREVLA